jgi:hypothetical protein
MSPIFKSKKYISDEKIELNMEAASRKWRRRTASHIFQKLTKGMLQTKMGRKLLLSGIVQSLYLSV